MKSTLLDSLIEQKTRPDRKMIGKKKFEAAYLGNSLCFFIFKAVLFGKRAFRLETQLAELIY